MGLTDPDIGQELAKFSEVIGENERFYLDGVRIVQVKSSEFGPGEMVVLKVRGQDKELGIWGSYLLAQARSVQPGDLHKWYLVTREVVPGFGNDRPVKLIKPAPAPAASEEPPPDF